MFEKGDFVIYGHTGICEVMGITTMNMDGIPKDRLYYMLRPEGETEGKIYTPVDNVRLVIRRMMSKEEAEQLIKEIPSIESLDIEDDKQREQRYKDCIKTCECKELIRIIKTIYLRKKDRLSQGKKVTATDEKYFKLAADNLYSELSVLLDVPKNKMESYITTRMKNI